MDCFYADRSFLRSRQRRKKKGILISLCLVLFCLSLLHLLNREERQLPPSTLSRRRHDGWMAMGFRASIGRREKGVHLWARHFRLVIFCSPCTLSVRSSTKTIPCSYILSLFDIFCSLLFGGWISFLLSLLPEEKATGRFHQSCDHFLFFSFSHRPCSTIKTERTEANKGIFRKDSQKNGARG